MEKAPLVRKVVVGRVKRSKFRSLFAASSIFPFAVLYTPAFAIDVSVGLNPAPVFPKTSINTRAKPSSKDPVLLNAQHVDYDKNTSIVTATGKVEIVQGDTIMLADEVTYDQRTNKVTARGNVSILESSGNVVFADNFELEDNLKSGVANEFKARLTDNSVFAANSAQKHDENITELHQAVYSPCKACKTKDGDTSPLWQLRADHVVIDKAKQKISYDDAQMQIYGVPIFYTPYFSHPTPGADNKSGLLEPTFKQSTNLGTVYKQPIYYSIAKDKDITVYPIFTSLEGIVMAGEYRQLFNNGTMNFVGSITKPQTRDAGGANSKGQNWRGHIDGIGNFKYDETTNFGFNIRRATDDTYLRRYDFSQDTLLTSKLYAEKYDFIGAKNSGQRSFADIQALKFDGLTADDNARNAPLILPLANFDWQSAPSFYNSRFSVNANVMSLTRDTGAESRRASSTLGWNIPYITSDGQVIEFATALRADVYSVRDHTMANGENFNGEVGRIIPSASLTWHYPFINNFESENFWGNVLVEPVVMLSTSSNTSNYTKIPNEDSAIPEFNTSNLFTPNRFAGYDRVETGSQVSYGVRGQAQVFDDKYINWLVGQHYRSNTNNDFPYSRDLNSDFSDYVGKLDVYYDPLTISYRTRLDKDSLAFNQNEVAAGVNYYPVSLNTSYLMLKNDPTLQDKEEISGSAGINLTRQWSLGMSAIHDLKLSRLSSTGASLTFQNECFYITNVFGKNYAFDRDIKPATTYMLRVSFKNLD